MRSRRLRRRSRVGGVLRGCAAPCEARAARSSSLARRSTLSFAVGLLGGVAHDLRRQHAAVAQLGGEVAERSRGLRGAEQRLQGVALAGLDALRQRDLFLVREHAAAWLAGREQARRQAVVVGRGSGLGNGPELERLLVELLASRGEGGDRCGVHGRSRGEMPVRLVGSLLVRDNTTRPDKPSRRGPKPNHLGR